MKKQGVEWTPLCSTLVSKLVLQLQGDLDEVSACKILRTVETVAQRNMVIILDGSRIRSATSLGVYILEEGVARLARVRELYIFWTPWGGGAEGGRSKTWSQNFSSGC